ncbi:MAG: YbhB/YbcL family Raf kinase inhibitor-like protein [Chloroflexi bacterium]|nr:YbhB/YbcL family Raf kinase inhibitor-like protein [Chloroflexota bacterium]
MKLEIQGVTPGGPIPATNTCSGANISPAVRWTDVPEETQTFAFTVNDPDAPAGDWVHWVIFDIPSDNDGIREDLSKDQEFANGTRQGRNDFKTIGYGGPCPPIGHGPHHYHFRVYALDTRLDLSPGATKAALDEAMQGHIIGQAEVIGTFERD